ncbi:MAG: thioredoxin family protein [Melioribacteraceae bacterium]
MILTLLISDNCEACERAKKVLEKIHLNYPQLSTEIIHINSYKGKGILITPALLIDNKLFCYGDIDEVSLSKKLNRGSYAVH